LQINLDLRARFLFTSETVVSYLGDRTVTSSTGYKLDANDKITFDVNGGSELWMVTATGTASVTVFEN